MSAKSSSKNLISVTESILRLRSWEKLNLPIEQSSLALDLFLVIAYNSIKGKPLTLKLLFYSLSFSEAGIRKHLRRLLGAGWCSLEGAAHDKRLRHVVAQPKMLEALEAYQEMLRMEFGKHVPMSARPTKIDSKIQ
jgi:hypothetical protein